MRVSKVPASALTASIAITALAGCGGGPQMAPTSLAQSGARSFMDPAAQGKPLVFVSYGGTVDIYLQRGKNKMVGQITTGGSDLATDAAGDLYSANPNFTTLSGTVTIYAPPYTNGPKLTLSGSSALVAVSRQGVVAVGTDNCDVPATECSFRFYPAGSTTPCATVALDEAAFPNGVFGAAFDRKGNLYAASAGSGTAAPLNVAKINGGCNAKQAKTLTTMNSIAYAAQIRVDKAGRIAIFTATSDLSTYAIDTYDPPKGASLGNPVSTTPLPATNYNGSFAFQASGLGVWAANYGFSSPSGASEYAYPAGGVPLKIIVGPAQSGTYGVAVTPALVR